MKPKRDAEVKSLNRLSIIRVDAVPPSVNHYKIPVAAVYYENGRPKARIVGFRLTHEAKQFQTLMALACRGVKPVYGKSFEIEIEIVMGPKQRGDWDNFTKVVCDPIAKLGMLRSEKKGEPMSDAHIKRGQVVLDRGESPRTTIYLIGVSGVAASQCGIHPSGGQKSFLGRSPIHPEPS